MDVKSLLEEAFGKGWQIGNEMVPPIPGAIVKITASARMTCSYSGEFNGYRLWFTYGCEINIATLGAAIEEAIARMQGIQSALGEFR
jgi:hypothetical protein